jgi:hypothetical protein
MEKLSIVGEVTFVDLATGFWGIIETSGKKWRPVRMPDELKEKGKKIKITAKPAESSMSVFMWGEPVEILEWTEVS